MSDKTPPTPAAAGKPRAGESPAQTIASDFWDEGRLDTAQSEIILRDRIQTAIEEAVARALEKIRQDPSSMLYGEKLSDVLGIIMLARQANVPLEQFGARLALAPDSSARHAAELREIEARLDTLDDAIGIVATEGRSVYESVEQLRKERARLTAERDAGKEGE